jgi:FkbM family methyltransferase
MVCNKVTELGMRKVGIEGVDEFIWPKSDFNAFHWPLQDWINDKRWFMQYVKTKNVVVQAGGCCGMYPRFYANYFKTVYTFEPDQINYQCLVQNTSDSHNVHHRNCALGKEESMIGMDAPTQPGEETNRGMFTVNEALSDIPMITIDSLQLEECDLIHFDLEGYETNALIGAAKTIDKFNPVIIVEKDSGAEFLQSIGYALVKKTSMDSIFVRN